MSRKFAHQILKLSVLLIVFASLFLWGESKVYASEMGSEPYITISSYEVSGDEIIPGQEFTVKFTLQNADLSVPAQNVLLNISTSENISFVYPSVPQVYLGNFEPNSSQEVSFTFLAAENMYSSNASFYVTTASDSRTNYVVLTAPVSIESQKITVLSTNIPDEGYAEESITSSLYFRTTEEDNLRNVELNVYIDDEIVATGLIGNMTPGASKTQSISFSVDEEGEHSLVFEIAGMDSDGTTQVVEAYKGTICITKRAEDVIGNPSEEKTLFIMDNKDKLIIICSGCLAVLCIVGIVLTIRKYR